MEQSKLISDMVLVVFSIAIVVLFWIYKKRSNSDDSLDNLGIAYIKPLPIIGNTLSIIQNKESVFNLIDSTYNKFPNEK